MTQHVNPNTPIEILVFKDNGKSVETKFRDLFPKLLTKRVEDKYGVELSKNVASSIRSMTRLGSDMIQLRHGNRRVRVRLAA